VSAASVAFRCGRRRLTEACAARRSWLSRGCCHGEALCHAAASVVYSETNIYSYLCKGRDNVNVSTCNLHDAICATAAAGHAIA
jgi:hypothetical protein